MHGTHAEVIDIFKQICAAIGADAKATTVGGISIKTAVFSGIMTLISAKRSSEDVNYAMMAANETSPFVCIIAVFLLALKGGNINITASTQRVRALLATIGLEAEPQLVNAIAAETLKYTRICCNIGSDVGRLATIFTQLKQDRVLALSPAVRTQIAMVGSWTMTKHIHWINSYIIAPGAPCVSDAYFAAEIRNLYVITVAISKMSPIDAKYMKFLFTASSRQDFGPSGNYGSLSKVAAEIHNLLSGGSYVAGQLTDIETDALRSCLQHMLKEVKGITITKAEKKTKGGRIGDSEDVL